MLPKPESCKDCPLYGNGMGFVPDTLVEGAAYVMGQNPGASEEVEGRPFVGATGKTMDKDYLPVLGLPREGVSFGNAIRCRWQNSNELPPLEGKLAREAVSHCTRSHLRIPASTKLVITQGAYALYAMTGHGHLPHDKITSWRGYMLPQREEDGTVNDLGGIFTPGVGGDHTQPPVLATLHIAAVNRNPALKLATKIDWDKGKRYLQGRWPVPMPPIHREIDAAMFAPESAWDTEYIPEYRILLRFSVYTGERLYVIENNKSLHEKLSRFSVGHTELPGVSPPIGLSLELLDGTWHYTKSPAHRRVFFQNGVADLPYLAALLPDQTVIAVEDMMLAHSVLFGQEAHSLDYLHSLCGSTNRYKHLDKLNPVVYSAGDALAQWEVWRWIEGRFKKDPDSERVYRTSVLPLIPVILESEEAGVLIDQAQVSRGVEYLRGEMDDSTKLAQAVSGYKLNLGSSQQTAVQLFDIEGLKPPRKGR